MGLGVLLAEHYSPPAPTTSSNTSPPILLLNCMGLVEFI